jgi:DNA-binding transcriptional MerR regulator
MLFFRRTLRRTMREHAYLKIGEFARIGHVSVATLHHYDASGLLKPSELDQHTGYRYYSLEQLPRLNRILALRGLGFSLEQIAHLVQTDLPHDQLLCIFEQRIADIRSILHVEQTRLQHITALFQAIATEDIMPAYDILLKRVEPLLVASIRDRIPHMSERSYLFEQLATYIAHEGMQIAPVDLVLLYSRHEMHGERISIDLEVAIPLSSALQGAGQIQVQCLPDELMAYTVHTGSVYSLGRAYVDLHHWIEANEYDMVGPVRQIHWRQPSRGGLDQEVTEIQFPVRHRSLFQERKNNAAAS